MWLLIIVEIASSNVLLIILCIAFEYGKLFEMCNYWECQVTNNRERQFSLGIDASTGLQQNWLRLMMTMELSLCNFEKENN